MSADEMEKCADDCARYLTYASTMLDLIVDMQMRLQVLGDYSFETRYVELLREMHK